MRLTHYRILPSDDPAFKKGRMQAVDFEVFLADIQVDLHDCNDDDFDICASSTLAWLVESWVDECSPTIFAKMLSTVIAVVEASLTRHCTSDTHCGTSHAYKLEDDWVSLSILWLERNPSLLQSHLPEVRHLLHAFEDAYRQARLVSEDQWIWNLRNLPSFLIMAHQGSASCESGTGCRWISHECEDRIACLLPPLTADPSPDVLDEGNLSSFALELPQSNSPANASVKTPWYSSSRLNRLVKSWSICAASDVESGAVANRGLGNRKHLDLPNDAGSTLFYISEFVTPSMWTSRTSAGGLSNQYQVGHSPAGSDELAAESSEWSSIHMRIR